MEMVKHLGKIGSFFLKATNSLAIGGKRIWIGFATRILI